MHFRAMNAHDARAQRIFACLGDPSRYRVVAKLKAGELCVTDLAREIGLSQSCTTRHLQALQREGLVVRSRSGKRVIFRLRTEEPFVAGLLGWAGSSGPYDTSSVPSASIEPIAASTVTVDQRSTSQARKTSNPPSGDIDDFLL